MGGATASADKWPTQNLGWVGHHHRYLAKRNRMPISGSTTATRCCSFCFNNSAIFKCSLEGRNLNQARKTRTRTPARRLPIIAAGDRMWTKEQTH